MDNNSSFDRRTAELFSAAIIAACMLVLIISVDQLAREGRQLPQVVQLDPIAVFPDFASITRVDVKKQQFFDYLQDYISAENQRVINIRRELELYHETVRSGVALSTRARENMLVLADLYRVPDDVRSDLKYIEELLIRIDQVPVSLALAQAANESAWGTSRFAMEGNNLFGEWCYEEGCGLVPLRRISGANHEVQSFDSLQLSVESYFLNLNSHPRYNFFRELRSYMRNQGEGLNSVILAYGLSSYSERGDNYVDEVQTIIEQNNLRARDGSAALVGFNPLN